MTEHRCTSQVAVVTGASSGIGSAIASALASRGAAVALVGRRRQPLELIADEIGEAGGRALAVTSDATDPDAVAAAAARIRQEIGSPNLLVNSAGIADKRPFVKTTSNEVDRLIDTNLKGPIYWTQAVLDDLVIAGGDIVNIASLAGVRSFSGWSLYGASKHGLVGFAGALAQELAGQGVRVLTLCPGATDTPLWSRAGISYEGTATTMLRPVDVAEMVLHMLEMPRHVVFKDVLMLPAGEWL